MIFHLFDLGTVNAWQLYRRDAAACVMNKKDILSLAEFKLMISMALMRSGKACGTAKQGRPSSSSNDSPVPKKRSSVPQNTVRYDTVDHLPIIEEKRNRCKLENCSGKQFLCVRNVK